MEAVREAGARGGRPQWPRDFPRPDPAEVAGPNGFTLNELFLTVGGFALLHGIGHVVCGHVTGIGLTPEVGRIAWWAAVLVVTLQMHAAQERLRYRSEDMEAREFLEAAAQTPS
jgi:hypothetical protein